MKQDTRNRRPELAEGQPLNPSHLPAERSVLGALIEDDSLGAEADLRIEDFFLADHQRVFSAIERLRARKTPVDYICVAEELGNRQADYVLIGSLVHGAVLHEGHVLHHIAILRKKARLRALLRMGEWILEAVTDTSDPDLLCQQIRNMLDACCGGEIRA